MSEDSPSTCIFQFDRREANAVVRRSARRNSRTNLHDGKNVIVLGKCGGVFTSDIRHILEPLAGLCIDDAKGLYAGGGGHIRSSHVEPAVARIEPYLITTTYLVDDL